MISNILKVSRKQFVNRFLFSKIICKSISTRTYSFFNCNNTERTVKTYTQSECCNNTQIDNPDIFVCCICLKEKPSPAYIYCKMCKAKACADCVVIKSVKALISQDPILFCPCCRRTLF
jgi:hypothetical protein